MRIKKEGNVLHIGKPCLIAQMMFVNDQLSQCNNNYPIRCDFSYKDNIVGTTQSNLSEVVLNLIIL